MSSERQSYDKEVIKDKILEIIRKKNENGEAIRFSEIVKELNKETGKKIEPKRVCDNLLKKLLKERKIVKVKLGEKKSSPTYYALKEYEYLLDNYKPPKMDEEHVIYIVKGLEAIRYYAFLLPVNNFDLTIDFSSLPRDKEKLLYNVRITLEHVLRGRKGVFKELADLLDSLVNVVENDEKKRGKKLYELTPEKRDIIEKIKKEALKKEEFLYGKRSDIIDGCNGTDRCYIGSCEICSHKLNNSEEETVNKWLTDLYLCK
jgi:hypothetical protein